MRKYTINTLIKTILLVGIPFGIVLWHVAGWVHLAKWLGWYALALFCLLLVRGLWRNFLCGMWRKFKQNYLTHG